jgi:nucleoid DNA-binding protein
MMNKMIEFIETLLYTNDCVIIPKFGGFVLNTKDFHLIDNEQTIVHKSKWVAFNERLQSEDGLLATTWAKEQGISQKQAFLAVHQFGKELSAKIKAQKQFQFGKIGVFDVSKSGRLQFEPNQTINFDLNQYGLEPVSIGNKKTKPVLIENPVERSLEDLPTVQPIVVKRTSQNKFYTFVLLAFLLGGTAAYFLTEPNSRFVNGSFSPLTIRIKSTKIAPIKPSPKVERMITEKPLENTVDSVAIKLPVSSGIYLVVGSFITEAKAASFQAELVSKGFQGVKIIEKRAGERYFRVSLGEMPNFDAGYAAAARLKTENKLDIWVYKR